jgi:uncharacterized membrane protein
LKENALKIKLPIDLLIIDILSVLLILSIIFIPAAVARVILGLPFLLFFPGYVLVAALFPRRELEGIERIALSFGMSIAVTALIGLGLNYTPWGIRLEPVLYSIFTFIIILSAIAIIRRRYYGRKDLVTAINLKMPGIWQGSSLNKTLNVILILAILGSVCTLIYTVAKPKVGEKFTEFYLLGINGTAADYPTDFVLNSNSNVVSVQYGTNTPAVSEKWGRVTLGIVNHEQQNTTYTVVMQIDGQQVGIPFQGGIVQNLGPIVLAPKAQWEREIGIVPQHTGENQEVELLLYKDNGTAPYLSLHLWVNVTQ